MSYNEPVSETLTGEHDVATRVFELIVPGSDWPKRPLAQACAAHCLRD